MDVKKKDINFAVIGCGLMGKRHAEILSKTPGANLYAVFDSAYSDDFKTALPKMVKLAASYEEILIDSSIDAVVICLPSGLHAEYGILAARHKKHVITEKPIAINTESAVALIKACEENRVQCHTISQNRFSEGMRALKQAVESQWFGKIVLVEASVKWFRDDEYYTGSSWRGRVTGEGGGVIMNQAIHFIDLLIWLFGEPESVLPIMASNRSEVMETEDTAVAAIKFPGNITVAFSASTTTYPGFKETLSVYGNAGACTIEQGKIIFQEHRDRSPLPLPQPTSQSESKSTFEGKYLLFQRQYFNIMDSINGISRPIVTPEESLVTLETARKFYQ